MCWFSETWGGAQVFFIVSCFYGIMMLSGHFIDCPPPKIDSTFILARLRSQCRVLCHFDNWSQGVAFCQNPRHDDISSNQPTTMTHLNFASQHGSLIPRQGLELCEDDNTFTPYTFHVYAWACLLSDAPKADPEPANPTPYHTWEELLAAMFD